MISIDALRCDRLGCYGYKQPTSPNVDKWSEQAFVFEQALSQAPWTMPSFASLFTGRYPHRVNVFFNDGRLAERYTTLVDLFQQHGYLTALFSAHPVLLKERTGFRTRFNEGYPAKIAGNPWKLEFAVVEPLLMAWLEEHAKDKFFCWVHLMETHSPRTPNNPYISQFKKGYDADVRFADEYFKHISNKVRELGIEDETMIIFTADHGEALGDHNNAGHQDDVYDEVMRVPLIIRYPGLKGSGRIKAAVELIDLFPTITDIMGFSNPKGLEGESLLPLMQGQKERRRKPYQFGERFYCKGLHHLTVRDESFKLYATIPCPAKVNKSKVTLASLQCDPYDPSGQYRLFDLINDPKEKENVAEEYPHPKIAKRMLRALYKWRAVDSRLIKSEPVDRKEWKLDKATRDVLRGLGYAE